MRRTRIPYFTLMFLLVLALSATQVHAKPLEKWVASYNGPADGSDQGVDIATDSAGNIYVTGNSAGVGTGSDYATIAYDSSGNELWVARYNGPGNSGDYGHAITTDSSGNIYVTGSSTGVGTSSDYATIAYDSSGNELWVARYSYNGPVNSYDKANAIATDSLGNVYVTGKSAGATNEWADYATVAYDSNGNELWVARYNGTGNHLDYANAIATDASGNVYVTGYSFQSTTGEDIITIAYDANGNELWVAQYNGPGNDNGDSGGSIATDAAGNVYVGGCSTGIGTGRDFTTIAYDANGNELWVARYNGPGNDSDTGGLIALDDSSGTIYVSGQSVGSGTGKDYATIAYDANGNELWVARYNGYGNDDDIARGIALGPSGNIYVTGHSLNGNYDSVTIAYDSSGNELWVAEYGKRSTSEITDGIVVDSSENVYVTGWDIDYMTIKY